MNLKKHNHKQSIAYTFFLSKHATVGHKIAALSFPLRVNIRFFLFAFYSCLPRSLKRRCAITKGLWQINKTFLTINSIWQLLVSISNFRLNSLCFVQLLFSSFKFIMLRSVKLSFIVHAAFLFIDNYFSCKGCSQLKLSKNLSYLLFPIKSVKISRSIGLRRNRMKITEKCCLQILNIHACQFCYKFHSEFAHDLA